MRSVERLPCATILIGICVLLLGLSTSSITWAQEECRVDIALGSVTATSTTLAGATLSLADSTAACTLSVTLESAPCGSRGLGLPEERVFILNEGRVISLLSTRPTLVAARNGAGQTHTSLRLGIRIEPYDRPDDYSCDVRLESYRNGESLSEPCSVLVARLTVSVDGWVRLSVDNLEVSMRPQHDGSTAIKSLSPAVIGIAGNVDWVLMAGLTRLGTASSRDDGIGGIDARVDRLDGLCQPITSVTLTSRGDAAVLAKGPAATSSESYWLRVALETSISDFRLHPAGSYRYGLYLIVEPDTATDTVNTM